MAPRGVPFKRTLAWVLCLVGCWFALSRSGHAAPLPTVELITDDQPDPPVQHGLVSLQRALKLHGILVKQAPSLKRPQSRISLVIGLAAGDGPAARVTRQMQLPAPTRPESLLIRRLNRQGVDLVLVTGSDARGLMYALLDLAEQISWAPSPAQPLSQVQDREEQPFVPERALAWRSDLESGYFTAAPAACV